MHQELCNKKTEYYGTAWRSRAVNAAIATFSFAAARHEERPLSCMKKFCIALLFLMIASVGASCAGDDIGETMNIKANTILSNSKLWIVADKGELVVLQPNMLPDVLTRDGIRQELVIAISGSDIQALSVASYDNDSVYAIKSDGTLWQVIEGDGTGAYRLEIVPDISGCVKVCTGVEHAIALTSDGFVYAWGDNTYGQLGNGRKKNSEKPQKVKGLSDIEDISSGYYHCMALNKNGNVYTWGRNNCGQLGDGRYTRYSDYNLGSKLLEDNDRRSAYMVNTLTDIVQIAAGSGHCFALRKDSVVFEWGELIPTLFELDPDRKTKTPTEVEGLENIAQISAFCVHALALSTSGDIWRWGNTVHAPGEGWDPPRKTAVFPDPLRITAGFIDTVITNNNEIWQGYPRDGYENGESKRIVSEKDIAALR